MCRVFPALLLAVLAAVTAVGCSRQPPPHVGEWHKTDDETTISTKSTIHFLKGNKFRVMYQARHTFASLMLSYGEDPLWVARMLGHTSTEMLYRHNGKFIRNRMRRDGMKFLRGLEEAKVVGELLPANPLPERASS